MRATTALLLATSVLLVLRVADASAGTYYVYSCSSYGNTAPAFTSWADSNHMNAANECMQASQGGSYRSLELNNPGPNAPVYNGHGAHWIANTPSPDISIIGAYTPPYAVLADCSLQSDGFSAQYFWDGGAQSIGYLSGFGCNSQGYGYGTGANDSLAPSSYFGWGVTCSYKSTCSTSSSAGAVLGVGGIRLTAEENSGPGLVADGLDNLWYQASHWVRGGGWPVGFTALDPSGVCQTDLWVNGASTTIDNTDDTSPDTASFTQCWQTDVVVGTLDTTGYSNGPLTITYAALNAAGVQSAPSTTLQVDNTPVTLSLSTPSDPDPDVWVNHSVRVLANVSAGPSGLAGTYCSTNSGTGYAYPSSGVTLDGTGVWKVSCSSWNNALDVSGQPAISTQTVSVHIDETPPSISFEPPNRADPQAVVVDTSDGQSGVAGGQVELRPAAGGNWESLATQFDGAHLRARFDDATLAPGPWTVRATSCDNAGNCASTQETLSLPVRVGSVSSAEFEQVRHPHRAAATCSERRAASRRDRHRHCRHPKIVLTSRDRVAFGAPARLRGRLTSAQGTPIAGANISILTTPANGLSVYRLAAAATTGSDGYWTTVVPSGPSRRIDALFGGSPTIQPSQSWATLVVPASIRVLRVWPRHIPWGRKVHIEAQLVGGYLPPAGALVRLRLGYGSARITYGVQEHVAGDGIFEVTNSFGPGPPGLELQYWLQECTLPEGDYPYAPACGPRDRVTVGGRS